MEYDLVKKRYLSDNERYADLINGLMFKGRQLIRAENLMDMDTQTGMWSRIWRKGKWKYKSHYRDLIKKVALGVGFVVVGIENQEEVHYLMPLRSMAYDVAEYERQAVQVQKKVKKRKGISRAEFLSGFGKDDVLMPCDQPCLCGKTDCFRQTGTPLAPCR